MITAKEAKEIATLNLKNTSSIFLSIQRRADDGNFDAIFDKFKLVDKEETKTALIEKGYVVEETDLHLKIKW